MDKPNASHLGTRLPGYEEAAQRAIAEGRIPGAVAMVGNGREILHASAFGASNRPDGRMHTLRDVFMIASMTKAITSVAGAQMLEQGRFALDQPVEEVLPDITRIPVLTGWTADGQPILRPPKVKPLMRHLFTHTSGHSSDVWNADTLRYLVDMKMPGTPTCKKAAFDLPLVFDPGDHWEYSIATDWLGMTVERLSGMRLEEYFQKHIFAPLGMEWTRFIISPKMREELVPVRGKREGGAFDTLDFEISQTPEQYMGGAGLYGSTEDYLKFLQMFLNGGMGANGRVLKPETVGLMFQNHIGDIDIPVMKTVLPALSVDVHLLPGQRKKWGLAGLVNLDDIPGRRRANSMFWGGLGSTYFWVDRKSDLAGVIMLSYFPFADEDGMQVFDRLEADSYAQFAR